MGATYALRYYFELKGAIRADVTELRVLFKGK
jgi:hypothetical protein